MHSYKSNLIIIFLLYASTTFSQSIFSLHEVTEGGTSYEIKSKIDTCKKGTIRTIYPNIDINSTVEIKINKENIKQKATDWLGVTPRLPVNGMKIISSLLVKRTALMANINFDAGNSEAAKNEALSNFAKAMDPFWDFVNDNDSLDKNNPLKAKIEAALNIHGNASYVALFDVLQDEIDHVSSQYQIAVDANKIYFRLGAFINQTAVHLEGFDTFKEGEYFRVPRFATTIGPADKAEFDKYKSIAEVANKDAGKELNQLIKRTLTQFVNKLKDSVKSKLAEPFLQFQSNIDSLTMISDDLKMKIQNTQKDISQINDMIKSLESLIERKEDPDYIANVKNEIFNLTQKVLEVKSNIQRTFSEVKQSDIPGKALLSYNNFIKSFNSAKDSITNFVYASKDFFETQIKTNLGITGNINESLLKLGDEVKKLPLENIPDETRLNLLYSTQRKDGDKLYLKAVIGKQPPGDETATEKTIEYVPIGLYQIGLHSTINAVLLFVDNLSAEYPAKTQFQLDPSYSVLFKLGSRKHTTYNKIFKIGAGLNMATLDFDNNNTPEIGVGIVLSTFNDYLQAGVGRNMTIDQNYWFLGIRLPFLGVDLTGGAKIGNAPKD